MRAKVFDVQNLLWVALLLALAGSLRHLAAMFAVVDGNTFYGYLSAVAVDAGLFSLSYSLRERKAARRGVKILWLGIVLFTGISVYGNYSFGIVATGGNLPGWIVASRPIVLAASLPLLVLYLAELVSDNRQYAVRVAEKEEKKMAKQVEKQRVATPLDDINAGKTATKEARKRQLVAIHRRNPHASVTELATQLDVSRATVRNYAGELGLELATNGNGKGA